MNLLAFDTSTDTVSIAVQAGDAVWQHTGPGGSQASATLIPAIRSLLAQAGMSFSTLDAIVFGRGPGSFTGLRTACAVAQGLAFGARGGAGVPVLPVDTLLAVADPGAGGGSEEKPVGTVHIAVAGSGIGTLHGKELFRGGREIVRSQAIEKALRLLSQSL